MGACHLIVVWVLLRKMKYIYDIYETYNTKMSAYTSLTQTGRIKLNGVKHKYTHKYIHSEVPLVAICRTLSFDLVKAYFIKTTFNPGVRRWRSVGYYGTPAVHTVSWLLMYNTISGKHPLQRQSKLHTRWTFPICLFSPKQKECSQARPVLKNKSWTPDIFLI